MYLGAVMDKVLEYKIERRIDDVVKSCKWLFFCEYEKVPIWCLVKYTLGTRYEFDTYGNCDSIDYKSEEVLLKSQDEDYIKQEFKNFTEGLK